MGIKIEPVDGNIYHYKGQFLGPPGTPYEQGIYKMDIELTESYPFCPPKVATNYKNAYSTFSW